MLKRKPSWSQRQHYTHVPPLSPSAVCVRYLANLQRIYALHYLCNRTRKNSITVHRDHSASLSVCLSAAQGLYGVIAAPSCTFPLLQPLHTVKQLTEASTDCFVRCIRPCGVQANPEKMQPEWEEMAATSCAVQNLWLMGTALGVAGV